MTITRLANGAYKISAMIVDPFYGCRLETQTYYGYKKDVCIRKYKAHLVSNLYKTI